MSKEKKPSFDFDRKLDLAKKLVRRKQSDVGIDGENVFLIAFYAEEEERLRNIVIERCLPLYVKHIGVEFPE